jgi:protein CrcB
MVDPPEGTGADEAPLVEFAGLPTDADTEEGARQGFSTIEPTDVARTLPGIALGGIIGTVARAGIDRLIVSAPTQFPWATFLVNVTGALVLGFLLAVLLSRWPQHRLVRFFLVTGVCGAFTTFSTLVVDAELLVRHGRTPTAICYVMASVVVGLWAVWLGMVMGRRAANGPGPAAMTGARAPS